MRLKFSTTSELYRIPAEAVVCFTAEGNYSVLATVDGKEITLTLQLGQVEKYLSETLSTDNKFIRIGKSMIVNIDFITCINPQRQKLILSDCRAFRREMSASKEALKALKEFIEKEVTL